jgi:glycerate kinase
MRVLAAPDKFRGTATAAEAAGAIAAAARDLGHECEAVPVADGGEGLLDCFGGPNRLSSVTGPSGDQVEAACRLEGERAVIEMARASGQQVASAAHDPVTATTRGTGELIVAAIEAGATDILVGAGGSATTDGGAGALEALGNQLPTHRVRVRVATDVTTRFLEAARIFGPQKGADADQVGQLTDRLRRQAEDYLRRFGVDVTTLGGSGAAGGLAGGLAALGARIVPGFDLVAEHLHLAARVARADLVITGEGHLDATSLQGKSVGGVLRLCAHRPARLILGRSDPDVELPVPAVVLVDAFGVDRAMHDTLQCIEQAADRLLASVPDRTDPGDQPSTN